MSSKTITGALLGAITGFILGWIIFGMILMGFYSGYMSKFPGLLRDAPLLWSIAITNLSWGLMLAYVFSKAGVNTIPGGISSAVIIMLLAVLGFDAVLFAELNLIDVKFILVDLAANAVMAAGVGAVIAWWMGRKAKTGH